MTDWFLLIVGIWAALGAIANLTRLALGKKVTLKLPDLAVHLATDGVIAALALLLRFS